MARRAAQDGDDGTNDMLVRTIVRGNELQVWFLSQHLVDTPLVTTAPRRSREEGR